jgi:hypothetical protein
VDVLDARLYDNTGMWSGVRMPWGTYANDAEAGTQSKPYVRFVGGSGCAMAQKLRDAVSMSAPTSIVWEDEELSRF